MHSTYRINNHNSLCILLLVNYLIYNFYLILFCYLFSSIFSFKKYQKGTTRNQYIYENLHEKEKHSENFLLKENHFHLLSTSFLTKQMHEFWIFLTLLWVLRAISLLTSDFSSYIYYYMFV